MNFCLGWALPLLNFNSAFEFCLIIVLFFSMLSDDGERGLWEVWQFIDVSDNNAQNK